MKAQPPGRQEAAHATSLEPVDHPDLPRAPDTKADPGHQDAPGTPKLTETPKRTRDTKADRDTNRTRDAKADNQPGRADSSTKLTIPIRPH